MNNRSRSWWTLTVNCFYLPKRNMNVWYNDASRRGIWVFIFLRGIWTYREFVRNSGVDVSFYLPKRNMNTNHSNGLLASNSCFYLPKRNMNKPGGAGLGRFAEECFYLPKRNMNANGIVTPTWADSIVFIFLRGIWTTSGSICLRCSESFYLPKRNMNTAPSKNWMEQTTCFYLPKRNMNTWAKTLRHLLRGRFLSS